MADRNRAMIADYFGGMSRSEVAAKYGLTRHGLGTTLRRLGIRLPDDDRSRRFRALQRPVSPGRTPIWPDCPPHLADDYALFRRKGLRAAEARAILDPEFQA